MTLITLHTSQENKAGEHVNRIAWNDWKTAGVLCLMFKPNDKIIYISVQVLPDFSFVRFKYIQLQLLIPL